MRKGSIIFLLTLLLTTWSFSQGHDHGDHQREKEQTKHHHNDGDHEEGDDHNHDNGSDCGHGHHGDFDPGLTAFHHIGDANIYSIGPFCFPLPCMLYAKDQGWSIFLSNKLGFDSYGHGDGHYAYQRYVLDGGTIKRVVDSGFPTDKVEIDGIIHIKEEENGAEKEVAYVCYGGDKYRLDSKSTADGGLFGGGITSFYDFSITKNVTSMILVCLFLLWLFIRIAKARTSKQGSSMSRSL